MDVKIAIFSATMQAFSILCLYLGITNLRSGKAPYGAWMAYRDTDALAFWFSTCADFVLAIVTQVFSWMVFLGQVSFR